MAGGSGGTTTAAGAPSSVHVALSELAIEPGAITVAEGGTLHVENTGSVPHNLAVVGQDAAIGRFGVGQPQDVTTGGGGCGIWLL